MEQTYVLVTAARNEEAYIDKTLQAVVKQTVLPNKWIVVSDGSTDRTDDIVQRYTTKYGFICLFRREPDGSRNFGSKVFAIQAGVAQLESEGVTYDYIGILDADVSFDPDYYAWVLQKFQDHPQLGIAGGVLFDACGSKWIPQRTSMSWSVSGPIQMFRRQCYEAIGGLLPLQVGGEDATAEVMARMHGWNVQAFPDMIVRHHRRTGTERGHILMARFRAGAREYATGYHPLFEVARCIARMAERPFVLSSLFRLSGFVWSWLSWKSPAVPDDIIFYLRQEQMQRLFRRFAMASGRKRKEELGCR